MALKKKRRSSSFDEKMAKEATRASAREKVKGGGGSENVISIKGGRYTLDGQVLGKEMSCVVVDFSYLRRYYEDEYKEGEFKSPTCFALSTDGEKMKPHDNSQEKQNKICKTCQWNEYGSGKGRSKACGDRRRIALIHVDDITPEKGEDSDDIVEKVKEARIAFVDMPPTSLKPWGKYLTDLANKTKRPFHSVVTKFGIDPDAQYTKLTFELDEKLEDEEVVDAISERQEDAAELIMAPYEKVDEDDKGKKKIKAAKRKKDEDEDDEDEEDEDEDSDDEDEDKDEEESDDDEDEDEDEEDEDEEDEDEEDEDDEDDKPKRAAKKKRAGKKSSSKDEDDEDDEDESDEDEDEDEESDEDDDEDEDERPAKKAKRVSKRAKPAKPAKPVKKKKSRFSK